MQQNGVYDLLRALEVSMEEGFPIIPGAFTVVKTKEVGSLIEKIYSSIPTEIQEARAFLRRRDELQMEARQKAEKIIADAQAEAEKRLSEADFIKALEREGNRIRTQVQQECEEINRKALDDAEAIRAQANVDASRTREGADIYAEQVFTKLEEHLGQLQQSVKECEIYMEKRRADVTSDYDYGYRSSSDRIPVAY